MAFKMHGRVKFSIIGAGLYVDTIGATTSSGVGEEVIHCWFSLVAELVRQGYSPKMPVKRYSILLGEVQSENQVGFVAIIKESIRRLCIAKGFTIAVRNGKENTVHPAKGIC